jgi:ABC-2 type transport system ATP-binding protein
MAALPGRTWLVESDEPRRAPHALRGLPGVLALAQIGTSLRVLGDAESDLEERLTSRLYAAGVTGNVKSTTPNLEDVFVAATSKPKERARESA